MIRLLMGITLSETGGSQRVVYDLISNLPESLYEITLVTSPGGELLDWIANLDEKRKNKIKIITISSLKRKISVFGDIVTFYKILLIMLKNKFDIAHFHNSKMGILGRLAASIAGIQRVYYTVHGWGLNRKTAGKLFSILSIIERILAHLTTEVVFVSNSDMETGIRNRWASKEASRLIFNGIVDVPNGHTVLRDAFRIPKETPVIAFVARLAEPKNPLFAIMVSDHLKAMGLEHRLFIIGDGPMYRQCMQLIEARKLHQQVILFGKCKDVRTLIKDVDIFCLFSQWEGLPISIIEAMYAGLPVVASNVGGISELVKDRRTGYLLDELDVEKAAGLLAELIKSIDLRKAMGSAGRAAALERFTLEGMVSGYRKLYEDCETGTTLSEGKDGPQL